MNVNVTARVPTRVVGSGLLTLTSGSTDTYLNSNARVKRIQFIVSNLDSTNTLYVQTRNAVNFVPVFPQTSITLELSDDFLVYNPSGSSINYMVGEVYPDVPIVPASSRQAGASAALGGSTAGGSGTGSSSSFSGGGGIDSGGVGGGHYQPR